MRSTSLSAKPGFVLEEVDPARGDDVVAASQGIGAPPVDVGYAMLSRTEVGEAKESTSPFSEVAAGCAYWLYGFHSKFCDKGMTFCCCIGGFGSSGSDTFLPLRLLHRKKRRIARITRIPPKTPPTIAPVLLPPLLVTVGVLSVPEPVVTVGFESVEGVEMVGVVEVSVSGAHSV